MSDYEKLHYIDTKYRPSKDDLVVEYYVEPNAISFEAAAEHLAAESSIGTWTGISTMNEKIAKTLKPHVFFLDKKNSIIKIAYSKELFEAGSMPQIYSSIAGNIFSMKIVDNLRLIDIHFPKDLVRSFPGPRHGVDGIRKLTGVKKRPLVGTIIKPKVGLNEKEHAKVAYDAWMGGLDIVKDDENLTNMSFNRFKERVVETLKLRDKAEQETGEKKIYMPNITAETIEMLRRAEWVKKHGGEYIMVDVVTAGFAGLQTVREHTDGVIHAHRAMHSAFTRNPRHGISMLAYAKCLRLVGVDQLHIGTVVGKMEGSATEVQEIEHQIEDSMIHKKGHMLEQDWHGIKPVLAVASGGLHPGLTPGVMKYMGKNIVMQYGGGCHGHPWGTTAGAKAIRESVDAVMKGVSLQKYAENHLELKAALKKWG